MQSGYDGLTIQEILLLVGAHGKSGEIVLESGNNIGSILVHNGVILQAFSPYCRAIGDLLVEQGIITEAELLEALAVQKRQQHIPLGMVLMQTGKVAFERIEKMVQDQIRRAIEDFSTWERLQVSFLAKEVVPFDRINLPAREFIKPETVKSVLQFLNGKQNGNAPAGAAPSFLRPL